MLRGMRPSLMGPCKKKTSGVVTDDYFAVKIPYYTGSHIRNFNPGGFLLGHTNMVSPLTFCIWVKTTLTRQQILLSFSSYYATSTTSFPFQVWITAGGGVGVALDGGGNFSSDLAFSVTGLNIKDGNWHHVGVIYVASSSFKIYVDGVKVDDRSISVTCNNPSGLRWAIGTFSVYNTRSDALDGYVGDMAYPIFAPSINSESIITSAYLLKP